MISPPNTAASVGESRSRNAITHGGTHAAMLPMYVM